MKHTSRGGMNLVDMACELMGGANGLGLLNRGVMMFGLGGGGGGGDDIPMPSFATDDSATTFFFGVLPSTGNSSSSIR